MSLAAHLIQRCMIQRAESQLDPYGNAQTTWRDYLLDVPCRLIEDSERVINSLTAEQVVVTTYTLLVDGAVDIQERDRVSSVVFEDGGEATGAFVVRAVLARHGRELHHKSVALERVA